MRSFWCICRAHLVLLVLVCSLLTACNTPLLPEPYTPKLPPPVRNIEPVRVALVLGGGGSRGIAQAGALEVLHENHIPIDLIVGCSAGSLIGAIYADDPDASNLKRKIIRLKKKDLLDTSMASGFTMLWRLNGAVKGHALKAYLRNNLRSRHFDDLQIPLVVVTTDVDQGETYSIASGRLLPALQASTAVPMVFSPVLLYGRKLADGGISSPLPVEVAKQYHPQVIIAIDIGTSPNDGAVNSVYGLIYRSMHISYYFLSKRQAEYADILIHPDIDKYSMFEDNHNDDMYEAGREAALKALPAIREKIKTLRSIHG